MIFRLLLLMVPLACGIVPRPLLAQRPPNIVLIVADDLGYGDLGAYGASHGATPNLDRLAAEGVRLTAFYANAPECTPTRAALLTGRYQHRVGGLETAIGLGGTGRYSDAVRLSVQGELGLPADHAVLPSALEAVGYHTALVGKWHLGYEPKFRPPAHGFDYSVGPLGGAIDYFHHTEPVGLFLGSELSGEHDFYRGGEPYHRGGRYLTHLLTEEATAWLGQQRSGRPFFLYLAYTAPHEPYQGPDDYRPAKLTVEQWKEGTPEAYARMVQAMDDGIGGILAKLTEMGLDRETLVIFVSDNGPTRRGSAGPFSGFKGSLWEGGIRVPALLRWPGGLPAGVVSDQPSITMDLTASILRVAGARPMADKPLDGIDIIGHVQGAEPPRARNLFWRIRRGDVVRKAARSGDLKYTYHWQGDGQPEEHLFDVRSDPAERHDLLPLRPDSVDRLRRLLAEWEIEVKPTRPELLE